MYKRFSELSFVIGLFFLIVSVILLLGNFLSEALASRYNLYAGIFFLIFGTIMMYWKKK